MSARASTIADRPRAAVEGRNTAARSSPAEASVCCTKRVTSSIQPASGTTPGLRNRSHGARAAFAADLRRSPSGAVSVTNRQPATSATFAVASVEPPSATITSRTIPAKAPGTSAASVGTSKTSDSCVAITTLIMDWAPHADYWPPYRVAVAANPTTCGGVNPTLECSCFVPIFWLGNCHGSPVLSPPTPAGIPLCPGRRFCAPRPAGIGKSPPSRGRPRPTPRRRGRRPCRIPARSRRAIKRFRALRAAGADRLRRRLAEPRRPAAVQDYGHDRRHAPDHHPQRFTGHFLRPLDQSLSRLRARLYLLLRAADPCLSRAFARARLRVEAVREARRAASARARTVRPEILAAHHRHRHQYRSLPADRTAAPDHAAHSRSARSLRPSGRDRHQVGAGAARPRYPRGHGETQSGEGCDLGDHARSQARPHDGAARHDAAAPPRSLAPARGRRRADLGDGRTGHSGHQ